MLYRVLVPVSAVRVEAIEAATPGDAVRLVMAGRGFPIDGTLVEEEDENVSSMEVQEWTGTPLGSFRPTVE